MAKVLLFDKEADDAIKDAAPRQECREKPKQVL